MRKKAKAREAASSVHDSVFYNVKESRKTCTSGDSVIYNENLPRCMARMRCRDVHLVSLQPEKYAHRNHMHVEDCFHNTEQCFASLPTTFVKITKRFLSLLRATHVAITSHLPFSSFFPSANGLSEAEVLTTRGDGSVQSLPQILIAIILRQVKLIEASMTTRQSVLVAIIAMNIESTETIHAL